MADLVLGMAKSAVEGTLTAAKSAIEEEEKMKKRMKRDLMLISDEFEMMNSFLNVASEHATDKMMSTMVRQVRNMALDVEDCIESVVLVDNNKSYWWRRMLPYCLLAAVSADAPPLDDAVTAVELLKSRVEALGQRKERYRHIGDSSSTKPTTGNTQHQPQAVADATARGILIEAREAKKYGGPKDLVELINKIDHVLPLQVISLWGAVGDHGVASIIKETCDDPEICKNFSCRAWVKLMHPFNPLEFIRILMAQFYSTGCLQQESTTDLMEVMTTADGKWLTKEFVKQVSDKRYLVFLEDVSSTLDWHAVRAWLPDENNGSCIVVHTRQLEVASLCVGQSHRVFELKQFTDEHSVCVFFNEAKKKRGHLRDLIDLIIKGDGVNIPRRIISAWDQVGHFDVASIFRRTCAVYPEICEKFNYRASVKLHRPFNRRKFSKSLLDQLCTNYCPRHGSAEDFLKVKGVMTVTEDKLVSEFVKQVISNQRYLVFLEDLSSKDDLDAICEFLPDKKNGSCIVVLTQQVEVATSCLEQSVELQDRTADHSVRIFYDEAKKNRPKDLISLIIKEDAVHSPRQIISACEEGGQFDVVESIFKKTSDECPDICKKFNYRASVKLNHSFNQQEFIKSLLDQLCTNYCPRHGSAEDFLKVKGLMMVTEDKLMTELVKQVMSNQRYVVFLEDLSSKDQLDDVCKILPDKKNGSCIVALTKQLEMARSCFGQSVLELQQRIADSSVRIFYSEDMDEDKDEEENMHKDKDEDEEGAIKIEEANEWLDKHKPNIVGRGSDIEYLGDNMMGVLSVFGMAGVGKSHIVRHVYFTKVTEQDGPFKKFGWVDVSHPFNIREFSSRLLLDLHSGSLQHASMLRFIDPSQECRQLLKKHACLIVIDGVQSREEWDTIKDALAIEPGQTKSRIIVIANEQKVAEYCSQYWWSVEGLEIDDALELFKKTAPMGPSSSDPSPADIERAKSVLHKCGGLPRVIIAAADHRFARGWGLDDFMPVLENHPDLRDLFSWVNSFFRSYPDELKPCIFYLSIFPVNHKIRRRRLVRRWIAEGYSRDTKARTAEEEGERSFEILCHQNMVQVPGSTSLSYLSRMPCCQVNGFFREYIVSRSMEENLVFALEGHCSVNSQRTGRHLTIGSTWDRDKNVYQTMDLTRMRSLTVFGKWETFFISDKMKIIRVLDLEGASSVTDDDFQQMVKLLPRLKFLSLRWCKEITCLPDSISGLRQLQTLDIRHTSVVRLPLSITKLQKLQYIRAGTSVKMDDDGGTSTVVESIPPPPTATIVMPSRRLCLPGVLTRCCRHRFSGSRNGGVQAPRGIGNMMGLHSISVIDASAAGGRATLEELKDLTQLHKLSVSGVNQKNSKELCSAISDHPHLKSLSVWLDKNDQAGCLDAISRPPRKLQSLKLYGCVDRLPAWIKLLQNLRKLKLHMDEITKDDLDILMYLQSLYVLCLSANNFQYEELRFKDGLYNLSVLEIDCNCRLKRVTFEYSELYCLSDQLEVLKIRCQNVSSLEFFGLQYLTNLKEVSLTGSYDDKVKQRLESQVNDHPRTIKPVFKSNEV